MIVTEKYKVELDLVRQNPKLLDKYRFEKDSVNSKHFDRLRLNIAVYNDLKQTDYEIVKFLFNEEKEWRKYGKDGEVDNLYFCAFILTLFNSPEIIWLFFESKNIDFDSGIGFDIEYLVSAGIAETYQYLNTVDNPLKTELLKYIGQTEHDCNFSQADINDWKENKRSYFRCYEFPIQDELYFLYSTNERELFLAKFSEWIKKERAWTYEELSLYRTYAKYADDKALAIEALKLSIEKNDKDFLTDVYNRQLAELYVEIGEIDIAFEILEGVIKKTENSNVVRDCVEQLCRIVIKTNRSSDEVSKKSCNLIIIQQKKYRNFSPNVDALIKDVTEIMKDQSINSLRSNFVNLKNKGLIITSIIFFLAINTTYYWEGTLGFFAFPVFVLLIIIYFGLAIALLGQIYFAIREKFVDKRRLLFICFLTFVLILTFFKPLGVIDFDKLEGEDVLVAQREGAANCMITFKLKADFTFRERNVCFGVTEVIGTYRLSNDTIYFEKVKRGKQEDMEYEFAIIEELEQYTENPFALKLFKDQNDAIGFYYFVSKNTLKIKPKSTLKTQVHQ